MKRVTFGFVNCNRLHYLRSAVESVLECTSDYENREFIIVDNASVEPGTQEYLAEKEAQGFKVFRTTERDPSNEFAKALNLIYEQATGDFICPLQADSQFIVRGRWLSRYVALYTGREKSVGCIGFDAQRAVTLNRRKYRHTASRIGYVDDKFPFSCELSKPPVGGAGDVMYSREVLDIIYPWKTTNDAHEGGSDSETAMYAKVRQISESTGWDPIAVLPHVPVSVGIYTDARGTNARIRGNKRYGDYWAPKDSFKYYEILDFSDAVSLSVHDEDLVSIERIAKPIGWDAPIDESGSWKKNPIRPETARPEDFIDLC